MIISLKVISALLSYPSAELQEARDELTAAVKQDKLLNAETADGLIRLINHFADGDIFDLQEVFVSMFDRTGALNLNLFEHVHGDSRDRGPAMVDLLETYRAAGFEPHTTELPDNIPVLLEFLAMRPVAEAQEVLADAAHILEVLKTRLSRRESIYASAFAALLHIADTVPDQEIVAELLAVKEDDPDDLEALDEVWEEAEVTFGPDPNAGCPQVRDILANMDIPRNAPPEAAQ